MPPSEHGYVIDVLRDVVRHLLGAVLHPRVLLLDARLDEVPKVKGVTDLDCGSRARALSLPVRVVLAMSHNDVNLRIVSVSTLVVVLHPVKLRRLSDFLGPLCSLLTFSIKGLQRLKRVGFGI